MLLQQQQEPLPSMATSLPVCPVCLAAGCSRTAPLTRCSTRVGPQSPAKQRSGTGQSASPASGSQREVRPSQGNAPSQPDSGPHVALSVLVDAFDRITGTTKRLVKEGAPAAELGDGIHFLVP